MDEETYAQIPETLELREIRYNVVVPGRRTRTIDVITTLVDADEYTKEDIAELYGFPLEFGTRYSQHQIFAPSGARSLQVARDGSSRGVDDAL